MYTKVLVLSNNCFSKSDSNGRTLANFFKGWDKNNLAQFFIQKAEPDFEVCNNYYRITDQQVLSSLKGKKCVNSCLAMDEKTGNDERITYASKRKRNAITMLLRNIVWNLGLWKNASFYQWIEAFNPEIILLQAGDCAFFYKLARQLSNKYNIPLVIYNSEGYYFKKFDYFRADGFAHWAYPLFRMHFCHEFKKCMKVASHVIYICDTLEQAYQKEFDTPSTTLYTSTTIEPKVKKESSCNFVVSYLGNLGVGRHKPLIEIGSILYNISPDFVLNIYGKVPNEAIKKEFEDTKGISYHGVISYEKVIEVMHESNLLVHVESFDPFYQEDLKFAFSTKIADSLACGTCFLLYAPKGMACVQYLEENNAAYVVNTKEALREVLELLKNSLVERNKFLCNAQKLVEKNHNQIKNQEYFNKILNFAHR